MNHTQFCSLYFSRNRKRSVESWDEVENEAFHLKKLESCPETQFIALCQSIHFEINLNLAREQHVLPLVQISKRLEILRNDRQYRCRICFLLNVKLRFHSYQVCPFARVQFHLYVFLRLFDQTIFDHAFDSFFLLFWSYDQLLPFQIFFFKNCWETLHFLNISQAEEKQFNFPGLERYVCANLLARIRESNLMTGIPFLAQVQIKFELKLLQSIQAQSSFESLKKLQQVQEKLKINFFQKPEQFNIMKNEPFSGVTSRIMIIKIIQLIVGNQFKSYKAYYSIKLVNRQSNEIISFQQNELLQEVNYFLTLFYFVYNKMDQEDYDDVRLKKTSYDKKLAILKEKIKNYQVFKKRKPRKSTYYGSFSRFETIALSDQRLSNTDDSGASINSGLSFKRQNFVRLFIEKMKLNSFNSIHNNRINLDRMKTLTSRIDNVTVSSQLKGPRGWKAPDIIKLLIAIVTLLTIVAIQFLATFQCLFQDYRQKHSSQIQIMILKQVLLAISIIRMLSKMLFVKTILGEKIQHIYQIFYHYTTSIDFFIDLIMLISIILIVVYPRSVFAGVFGCCGLILNILYFQTTNKQIQKLVINNNIKKQIFALFRLLLANLFISHIVGIIIISVSFIDPQINWMSKYGIENQQWFSKYIYGIYYATTIITTVGFGDFTISNRAQAICVTFVMLFGCILLSYNITKVSNIIESLNQVPEKIRNQLLVLDRLAAATQIDQNLHHTIGQYIIHVGEIRRTFEVTERHQLIQSLPSQLKQQFIQQSSKNFCSKLPFFYMLQMQTKKRICELLKMEVMSPNQYLTHKKLGLKKIIILRKGIVGLAYRKKGSSLNGRIVDTIQINSETEPPQLLNTYLLVRGRRLHYDIVCQKYCIVALLQFEQFIESIKESQTDYQLYHQTYDQANFRTSEWYRNKCTFCNFKHSIFVCPKMHYVPLRSMVFMKHQKNVGYNHFQKRFRYQRQKIWYSKCSPLKFWRKLFVPFQKVFDTHIQKSQILRLSKEKPKQEKEKDSSKWAQFEYFVLTKQNFDTVSVNVDMIQNYKYYFHKDNANNLIQKSVTQNKNKSRVQIQRFDEVELSQYAFCRS